MCIFDLELLRDGYFVNQIIVNDRFSWLNAPVDGQSRPLWDTELRSSDSFVVVPSLGSLVPGWLLVVPRRPIISLRELSLIERDEMIELVRQMTADMHVFAKAVYAFEHGSGYLGSATGCGLDHAHLHLVPLDFDLVKAATTDGPTTIEWEFVDRIPLMVLPPMGEYVSLWRADEGAGVLGTVRKPISQWMRRLIARQLGIDEEWNYRKNPQMENIQATVDALRPRAPSTK